MKAVVLIDNEPHPEFDLLTEHGLSIYFEADGLKWLFDVGASEKFHINAERLGISIPDIDFLVLSHAHSDHTGGVMRFLEVNDKAFIIMSSKAEGKSFYSSRTLPKKNIGSDNFVTSQNINRFIMTDGNMRITKSVFLINDFPGIYDTPRANIYLSVGDKHGEYPDKFQHEVALVVNTSNGIVALTGCSHNGILNILDACSDYCNHCRVIACIGGTHLVDCDSVNISESEGEIGEIGKAIASRYPDMNLITGHCTGLKAKKQLSAILGDRFSTFHSGTQIDINLTK